MYGSCTYNCRQSQVTKQHDSLAYNIVGITIASLQQTCFEFFPGFFVQTLQSENVSFFVFFGKINNFLILYITRIVHNRFITRCNIFVLYHFIVIILRVIFYDKDVLRLAFGAGFLL